MMSTNDYTWPGEDFDAVQVMLHHGQCTLEGTDGDRVELVGDFDTRDAADFHPQPAGRRLQLYLGKHAGPASLTLRLPKHKAWGVELSAARADVDVHDVWARLSVMLGKGDLRARDYRGVLSAAVGDGQIEVIRFRQLEVPVQRPEPDVPPFPPSMMPCGPHRSDMPWDWMAWETQDWEDWGDQIGQRVVGWMGQFNCLLGHMGWSPEAAGIGAHVGKGGARLADVEAAHCTVNMGSGDVDLREGRITNLAVHLKRGAIECQGVVPAGDWDVDTRHGDIRLSLPPQTQARLDVATRHGEIRSEVPLVRVGRPGPEARYGGRMVGTVGQAEGTAPQICLATIRGDIRIEGPSVRSPIVTPPPEAANASGSGTQQPPIARPPSPYDSQLAVLQALGEHQISVEEADQLLHSLEH